MSKKTSATKPKATRTTLKTLADALARIEQRQIETTGSGAREALTRIDQLLGELQAIAQQGMDDEQILHWQQARMELQQLAGRPAE